MSGGHAQHLLGGGIRGHTQQADAGDGLDVCLGPCRLFSFLGVHGHLVQCEGFLSHGTEGLPPGSGSAGRRFSLFLPARTLGGGELLESFLEGFLKALAHLQERIQVFSTEQAVVRREVPGIVSLPQLMRESVGSWLLIRGKLILDPDQSKQLESFQGPPARTQGESGGVDELTPGKDDSVTKGVEVEQEEEKELVVGGKTGDQDPVAELKKGAGLVRRESFIEVRHGLKGGVWERNRRSAQLELSDSSLRTDVCLSWF